MEKSEADNMCHKEKIIKLSDKIKQLIEPSKIILTSQEKFSCGSTSEMRIEW